MNARQMTGIVLLCATGLLASSGCRREAGRDAGGRVTVITTLFPLYDFARQTGGEAAAVRLLLPPGVEAHSYEPTPRDILALNTADVLIYAGPAMEPWMADIIAGIDTGRVMVVDTSRSVPAGNSHSHDHHEHDSSCTGGQCDGHIDPHFWLDFSCATAVVAQIGEALEASDPENAEVYRRKAGEYQQRLMELDAAYREALARCRHSTIIYGGHNAFSYLSRRYGVQFISPYKGFSPNAEPRPRDIARILRVMEEQGQEYIFHEELIEPRVARTLAEETGARLLLLHGAHNISREELERGVTFPDIMAANLERLKQGLGYQ